jgi:2-oxoglutarate dehydrogenase E2 component (dihydrolipoamide succinyltransferase)
MSTIVKMPQLGESVIEGTVARWLSAPGDRVAKNQPLLEISTDKIDTEVPAPADGLLLEIRVAAGATVKAGSVLALIGSETEYAAAQATPGHAANMELGRAVANGMMGDRAQSTPVADSAGAPISSGSAVENGSIDKNVTAGTAERPSGRSFVSPVVARMAAEHHLDLSQIAGTGLGGRVTKKDVNAFLQRRLDDSATAGYDVVVPEQASARIEDEAHGIAPEQEADAQQADAQEADALLNPDEVLTPLTAMRRAIAQHMVASKRTSPHVTTIFEADMTAVIRHREAHKRSFAAKGIALTYTPYFIAAIVTGLRAVPEANSRFIDAGIAVNKRMHIGIAVALAHGLLVPVLRDADEKNLQGLARQVNELVERTRSNSLRPDDVQGGTFTLTNHGTGGSLLATPIINQPQTGILGVGAIAKRPVVRTSSPSLLPNADDSIVIRPMCYLSFTFDHRVLDGAQGDAFLTAVKQRLENWQ